MKCKHEQSYWIVDLENPVHSLTDFMGALGSVGVVLLFTVPRGHYCLCRRGPGAGPHVLSVLRITQWGEV